MSSEKNKIQIFRPFGPSVAKVIMSEEIIKLLNDYVDKIVDDKKKSIFLEDQNQNSVKLDGGGISLVSKGDISIEASKKVSIKYYDSNNLKLFSEQLLNSKQNSIVVGHSNTTPILAGLLTGKVMNPFNENIYNRVYKVIISQKNKKLFVFETSYDCN